MEEKDGLDMDSIVNKVLSNAIEKAEHFLWDMLTVNRLGWSTLSLSFRFVLFSHRAGTSTKLRIGFLPLHLNASLYTNLA